MYHKPTATLATSGESPWEKDGGPEHFRPFVKLKNAKALGHSLQNINKPVKETSHYLTHNSISHAFYGSGSAETKHTELQRDCCTHTLTQHMQSRSVVRLCTLSRLLVGFRA